MKTDGGVQQAIGRDAEVGTRDRIARVLIERGPQTVAALSEEFGLTAAGVRRHLDALVAEGAVVARLQNQRGPRGRGRPASVWAVTDTGRATSGQQGYDALAIDVLGFLRDTGGDAAVEAYAQARARGLEERYSVADADSATASGDSRQDAQLLAELLSDDGYAATTTEVPSGTMLCQHHCPVQHVAAEFPALCEAETEALSRLLGTHVQRLATLAHGDGVCTLHIPHATSQPATRRTTEGSRS